MYARVTAMGDQGIRNETNVGGARTMIAVNAIATIVLEVSWL